MSETVRVSLLLVISFASGCDVGAGTEPIAVEPATEEWETEVRWGFSGNGPSVRQPDGEWSMPPICLYYGGKVDHGFVIESGEWVFERADTFDKLDRGRGRVLYQAAAGLPQAIHVTLNKERARDLELKVSLRPIAGEMERGGGVMWRVRDERNHYAASVDAMADCVRVERVVDGVRTQLARAGLRIPSDAWTTLTVRMEGDRIECALDGEVLVEVRDNGFPEAGRTGLWTKADARTEFDGMTLKGR